MQKKLDKAETYEPIIPKPFSYQIPKDIGENPLAIAKHLQFF
jgi:hypothetical protein